MRAGERGTTFQPEAPARAGCGAPNGSGFPMARARGPRVSDRVSTSPVLVRCSAVQQDLFFKERGFYVFILRGVGAVGPSPYE